METRNGKVARRNHYQIEQGAGKETQDQETEKDASKFKRMKRYIVLQAALKTREVEEKDPSLAENTH